MARAQLHRGVVPRDILTNVTSLACLKSSTLVPFLGEETHSSQEQDSGSFIL